MKKIFILQLIFLFAAAGIYAQNIEYLELSLPTAKIPGCRYNKIQYLDSRPDTTYMGFVQTGFFNKKAKVVPKTPLSVQITRVFNALADTAGKSAKLLFQLRQFSFAEVTGSMSEKGYCYLRAGLYAYSAGKYQKIQSVDTVIVLKSSIDVTRALLRAGRDTIGGFMAANILHEPAGPLYTLRDLLNIDSVEKSSMKLYNTAAFEDGLYLNYKSFMEQMPDKPITVDGGTVGDGAVKTTGKNGKPQKVNARNIYAVVFKGQPYIVSRGEYYLLKKEKNDFFFTGKAQVTARTGDVVAASILFGVIGGLIAANADATFEMKIDHVNGEFIRLKEIPDPPVPEYHE